MPTKEEVKPKKESKLLDEKKEVKDIEYTEDEKNYIKEIQKRLESAHQERERPREEFDGLTYTEYLEACQRGANTQLKPIKNKGESVFRSGTLETKMKAVLSTYLGLNLKPSVSAYNEFELEINSLGNAMEDVLDKTAEMDQDDEKRMLRQLDMLKFGDVFVQDLWYEKLNIKKNLNSPFLGDKTGVTWTTEVDKEPGRPRREIISGEGVYLGSTKKYFLEDQPYIFTYERKNLSEAEKMFGKWEMWKHVFAGKVKPENKPNKKENAMINNAWRLSKDLKEDEVEILRYEDKPNNEYQIFIQGVPMLPVGFPLTELTPDGEYSIIQQHLNAIRSDFAYGKSFIFNNKNIIAILDEMMRLAVLKTQKSFMPPYLNLSQRMISKKVFMPGQISRGIKPGEIQPISEHEIKGVTQSEFNMMQDIKNYVDENTVSQTYTGSKERGQGGNPTATQILELQRQSRIMMGLLTLSATLLEHKLAEKRLKILLKNWFDPITGSMEGARNYLKTRYRLVSRERMIEGVGMGMRLVVPTDKEIPSPDEIKQAEDTLEKKVGKPVRMTVINPEIIKQAGITWKTNVEAKDRKSSEMSKLLFGQEMRDAIEFGLRIDPSYIEQRFAEVWDENPQKMFLKQEEPMRVGGAVQPGQVNQTPNLSVKMNQEPGGRPSPSPNLMQ